MPLIDMQQVTRTYRLGETDVLALRALDLQVEAGEFVAIWGPSGSGKSTLCNLIGAIDQPTGGRVIFNGRDLSRLSDDLLSQHRNQTIGFIFQGFNLVKVLTALENVMLPLTLRGEPTAACRARATELLEQLGLGTHLQHRPDRLSGGQQQRVAIARALVTRPALVIADEPTANLDSENAAKIIDLMRECNQAMGITFIFSTHDQRLIDRVGRRIRLQDGTIIEDRRVEAAAIMPEGAC